MTADRPCPNDLCVLKILQPGDSWRVIKSPGVLSVITLTPSNDILIYKNTTLTWGRLGEASRAGDHKQGESDNLREISSEILLCLGLSWTQVKQMERLGAGGEMVMHLHSVYDVEQS